MVRDYWFPKPPTVAQMMRENRRVIAKTVRELDREKIKLEGQEKAITQAIRNIVKEGTDSQQALRSMAKDLVRARNTAKKLVQLKSQMQAIDLRMTTLHCTNTMCSSLQAVTGMMSKMNAQMSVQKIGRIMMEFEKQNARANEASEMMDDVIGEAFADETEGEETEELINQVLDEIGCNVAADMARLPASAQQQRPPAAGAPMPDDAPGRAAVLDKELEDRLHMLQKK